jgi:uncharacterized glyoxalase superfamily protein PhnB
LPTLPAMNDATVFPSLKYDDAHGAIGFLIKAFGAERHAVYTGDDNAVVHAELRFGNGLVMLGPAQSELPATRGRGGGIYIVVDDVDAHHERARAAGAEITRAPHDTDYGSREYAARDPEANVWSFGTYQPFAYDHEASS